MAAISDHCYFSEINRLHIKIILKSHVDILKNILTASKVIPPHKVKESFGKKFPSGRNLEWSKTKGYYEVIFYENDTEKIARISDKGDLLEYRINLKPESLAKYLPQDIIEAAKVEGEIMNCIPVHSNDNLYYEFIVRDQKLIRYLLLIDAEGTKISLEKL
jgi:hypothetical protein